MSENKDAVASAGGPTRLQFDVNANANNSNNNTDSGTEGGAGAGAAGGGDNSNITDEEKLKLEKEAGKDKMPSLSPDQIQTILKEQLGEHYTGNVDDVKNKLKPVAAAPTAEDLAKTEAIFEKRMLDTFIDGGGTVETFAAIKNILAMDLKELSVTDIRKELEAKDFSKEEIDAVMKERYYQINPEELVKSDDETEDEFDARKKAVTKKVTYATEKMEGRGKRIQDLAKSTLANLRTAIEQSDMQKREQEEEEKTISSKTDEYFAALPKKLTLELGKDIENNDIPPISYDVTDADIKEVQDILKDPTKRNNIFFNEDNTLNVASLADLLLENRNLKNALKVTYSEGSSRAVEHFKTTFPFRTAQDVANSTFRKNVNDGKKGEPTTIGKSQRVVPQS